MALIAQAIKVQQTVKNVGRFGEVLRAMTRFGFATLLERIGFQSYVPAWLRRKKIDVEQQPWPVRVRLLFEELGPSFIKIGQVLSGRPDLIPLELVEELSRLQDRVAPLPFAQIQPILEAELGGPIKNHFASFDPEPMATASIAQVHQARTLDGLDVVVKILKPGVAKILQQDLDILILIAEQSERYVDELRPFRPSLILREFKKSLLLEVDFTQEARNIRQFQRNFADDAFVVIPKVYGPLSTRSVLTLQKIHGVKLSDRDGLKRIGIDIPDFLQKSLEVFNRSVMEYGLFHADPHAGNMFATPDGRLGLIDFGSVGRLSPKLRDSVVNMFLALLAEDYEGLVTEYLHLSPTREIPRPSQVIEEIQREVADLYNPYFGLPLKEIPAGKMMMEGANVAIRHQITLPKDLVLLFRATMTMEGIGRTLDPNFDLTESASQFAATIISKRYSPKRLAQEAFRTSRDWIRLFQNAPRQLSEVLRQLENGQLLIKTQIETEKLRANATRELASKISISVLAVGALLATIQIVNLFVLPLGMAVTLWTVSATLMIYAVLRNLR